MAAEDTRRSQAVKGSHTDTENSLFSTCTHLIKHTLLHLQALQTCMLSGHTHTHTGRPPHL